MIVYGISFPLLAPSGSEALPSYGFRSGPGEGFFLVSDNNIGISLNAAERMRLTSGGSFYGLSLGANSALIFGSSLSVDESYLVRDAAAVVGLKGGTTPQSLKIYGSTTGPLNVALGHDGTNATYTLTGGGSHVFADTVRPSADAAKDLGSTASRWAEAHLSTSVRVGTNPATSGAVRLPNVEAVVARNVGNSANMSLIYLDSGNIVVVGDGGALGLELRGYNYAIGGAASAGGGQGVIFIANCTTAPTTNPTGGGIFYVEAGALKYRGSSGTVTTIAPA